MTAPMAAPMAVPMAGPMAAPMAAPTEEFYYYHNDIFTLNQLVGFLLLLFFAAVGATARISTLFKVASKQPVNLQRPAPSTQHPAPSTL